MNLQKNQQTVIVHLSSGIGNVILAIPLLVALDYMDFAVHVLIHADYPQTADIMRDWAIVHEVCDQQAKRVTLSDYDIIIPAILPFYWPRFARLYSEVAGLTRRSPDALFYQDEQEY
jgi:hypothetical protein